MSLGETRETLKDTTFTKGENLEGKSAVYNGYGFDQSGKIITILHFEKM